jgi:hypothetical protein
MAISQTIELSNGLIVENAYGKIETVGGGKMGAVIELKFYKDFVASTSKVAVRQDYINFVPNTDEKASNFIKQGYEYLKTLDDYADAIDC